MSELKSYIVYTPREGVVEGLWKSYSIRINGVEVYLKSEADKVIADLIEKNKRLSNKNLIMASETIKDLFKEINHHKYKRCLAMADFCSYKAWYYKYNGKEEIFYRWMKFRRVWVKLAEKFKEAK